MTKWLASVKSLTEAQTLTKVLPDILDMKNPSQGALGALNDEEVAEIVKWVNGRCLTSATIGDLPMHTETISAAIDLMALTGVDFVKVGLFSDDNLLTGIQQLQPCLIQQTTPVIAVLFADQQMPALSLLIPLLHRVGFTGVMVDTATKDGQGLLQHWSNTQLKQFIELVRQQAMLCGLAGALRIEDIDRLQQLDADYLGFRSALCDRRQRTTELLPALAYQIQDRLQNKTALAV